MAKNFPIRKKAISPRFQEAQYTPSKGKGVKKKKESHIGISHQTC